MNPAPDPTDHPSTRPAQRGREARRPPASALALVLVAALAPAPAAGQDGITITASPAYAATWDGNDAAHFDPQPPPAGAAVPDNLALATNGAAPFTSSDLGPELGIAYHIAANLNDGSYGNLNSWIGASGTPGPWFAGVDLGGSFAITAVAWGRDNGNGEHDGSSPGTDCCGGQLADRSGGTYRLEITTDPAPGPDSGWTEVAEFAYGANADTLPGGGFTSYFRHAFEIETAAGGPVVATGVRVVVPATGLGAGTAIDELEVYGTATGGPGGELLLVQQGGSYSSLNLARGAGVTAFARDVDAAAGHAIAGLNDGIYGEGGGSSWGPASAGSFAGISLGAEAVTLASIAFGRDNTGTETDRAAGDFTAQYTDVPNPDENTPDGDWTTLDTLRYEPSELPLFSEPHLRHRYNFEPVQATGVRLLVPGESPDDLAVIDEIELYAGPGAVVGTPPALTPLEEGGEAAAGNLAAGATPFARDVAPGGTYTVGGLNDGVHGDANAWRGDGAGSFAGLGFGDARALLRSVAFGRDNTGAQTDGALGTYTLQVTTVPDPDENTLDGDWVTIGQITYTAGDPAAPHLRHRFNFGEVEASGVRLLVPGGAVVDELEVYAEPYVPPLPPPVIITPEDGFAASWDGNDGDHFDPVAPPEGAAVPDNFALAANGATALGSSQLGLGIHLISAINDGTYGNANSWISGDGDPNPFIGVALPAPAAIATVAWGRDNGNGEHDDSAPGTDCCGGQVDDRWQGIYTLQISTVEGPDANTPDADWTTVATFDYQRTDDIEPGGEFTAYLRHAYQVSTADGRPLTATGVRILVPMAGLGAGTCIDELELYGPGADPDLFIAGSGHLGTLPPGAGAQTFSVEVRNAGATRPLEVRSVSVSGPAAGNFQILSAPSPGTIEPGATATVEVRFDPAGAAGRFAAQLDFLSNDELSPDTEVLALSARVQNENLLLMHFPLDETEGSTMSDLSGNGFHGAFAATGDGAFTLGEPGLAGGRAVRFDDARQFGSAGFATVDSAALPPLHTFSVSMWVRLDPADAGTSSTFFSKGSEVADPFALVAGVAPDGSPLQFFSAGEGAAPTDPVFLLDTVHHLVVTHRDTNGELPGADRLRIFLDGTLVSENVSPPGFDDTAPSPFMIGAAAGRLGLNGWVDDVQVYEAEISALDVATLFADPGQTLGGGPAPDIDSDGDGRSDAEEALAGTDPNDPDSRFYVAAATRSPEGVLTFTWTAAPGRTYRVEFKNALTDSTWQALPGAGAIPADTPTFTATTAGGPAERFFRVVVNP